MSKKKRQINRERKKREDSHRWMPDTKSVTKLIRTHWLGLAKILIPVIAGFVVYYLTVAEPDIRFITMTDIEETDKRVDGQNIGSSYQTALLRYRNFSFKSGYVDKIEFTPASLNPAFSVRVLEVEKVQIGWGEQKDIQVKFILTVDIDTIAKEYKQGTDAGSLILDMRAYDNTGKLLLDVIGGTETARLRIRIDQLQPQTQPSKSDNSSSQ